MLYFEADFPANTPSKELYEMIKEYKLNVTEMVFCSYAYGSINMADIEKILTICYAFNVNTFHITNRADG
jgi:hypothetical protein